MDVDGGPSSVVQPPFLKPDVDVMGRGGTVITQGASEGFGGLEKVVHPGLLKHPPEDESPTVDQPPVVNPDFFSAGVDAGSAPRAVVEQ